MSVFVDIAPDEPQVSSSAAAAPSKWRGRLTRAALAAVSGVWNQTFVPYPSTVWKAFLDVSTTHDGVRGYAGYLLWEHLYMTLRRVLVGVVIGVAVGVLLGLVMGSVSWVRSVLEPWLTFLRALPPLAYFFLLVIWLGIDEAPKITLLALAQPKLMFGRYVLFAVPGWAILAGLGVVTLATLVHDRTPSLPRPAVLPRAARAG